MKQHTDLEAYQIKLAYSVARDALASIKKKKLKGPALTDMKELEQAVINLGGLALRP